MRFVMRIAGLLGSPMVTDGIRARWMSYLVQMDAGLATKACTLFIIICQHEEPRACQLPRHLP